jgi:hypothetical protein
MNNIALSSVAGTMGFARDYSERWQDSEIYYSLNNIYGLQ